MAQKISADMAGLYMARDRLGAYAKFQWPAYRLNWHHLKICEALEAVERGEIKRLIITVPPRHGKSMLASEFFPAWYMGRHPDHYVVISTYGQDLADDFGRKVKNQIEDPSFRDVFPTVGIAEDSKSARRFHIETNGKIELGGFEYESTQRGAFYAVGVGGPLTGRGAHVLLIDDPLKSREEADSEVIRKKLKDWFTSTAYTRLMPGGAIIIILTRWHEDDLAGWQLAEHAHEGWVQIDLPATDPSYKGGALWPKQYDLEALEKIKLAIGPRDWSALYMQRPSPETGDYFQRDWIKSIDEMPPRAMLNIYGGSDYAVKKDGGDYTVHVIVGVDGEGFIYLLDMWRGQTASDEWVEAFCNLVKKWKPIGWAEETGQITAGVGPFLTRRMVETGAYVARKQFPTRGDKAVRAQSIRGRIAMRGLYVPRDAPFTVDLISEMMAFPVGVHDDQVDALGLVGQLLDVMVSKKPPREDARLAPPPGKFKIPPPPDGRTGERRI